MVSIAVLTFPLLMIFAACMDLFTMRIPNRISVALVGGFLPLAMICGLPIWSLALDSIALHYACGLFVLVITFSLFAWGKIGGGDAKLAAASAIWIGWDTLTDFIMLTALVGGALALVLLTARSFALPVYLLQQPWIARLQEPKGGVPYGVAFGVGGLLVYEQTPIWLRALGG